MPRAVRFDEYGDADVLHVVDVDPPRPGPGGVVVAVKAAGVNPGESAIRSGVMHERYPASFPSGQGSDFAGVVRELGPGVEDRAVGDEVIGFTDDRASHAELVLAKSEHLTPKPPNVPWDQAGALFVVGTTAWAAVRAVNLGRGDVLVVSAAAGGVGTLVVQLATGAGATVIGLAGPSNHAWLTEHGAIPVAYGHGQESRIRAAAGEREVDAFIDLFGDGYVELALSLGVDPDRIDTIIDFAAAGRHGVRTAGNADAASADVLAKLAALMADGRLEVPIARTYRLEEVRDAVRDVERRHTRGKIVLVP